MFAPVLELTPTVHFIFSHDLYLRTGFTQRAVHLSASRLQKFSVYGMTATDVRLLSALPCFRAPQEPRPLIHDARSGVKRQGQRLDKRYYTRAFICYRESNARRSFGQYNLKGTLPLRIRKLPPYGIVRSSELNSWRQSWRTDLRPAERAYTDRDPVVSDLEAMTENLRTSLSRMTQ